MYCLGKLFFVFMAFYMPLFINCKFSTFCLNVKHLFMMIFQQLSFVWRVGVFFSLFGVKVGVFVGFCCIFALFDFL